MAQVPNVPGVPPLPSYSSNNVGLLTADALVGIGAISSLFSPQWGIYSGGNPVISPAGIIPSAVGSDLSLVSQVAAAIGLPNIVPTTASTIKFDYSADSPISNYPQEQGAFQSYDKVQLPAEIGLSLACGGSPSQRQGFLQILEALRTSTALVDIVTPEQVYSNYNMIHYDFERTADNGVQLIKANLKFQLVPITASVTPGSSATNAAIATPQNPTSTSPQSLGNVQPQPVFTNLSNQFSVSGGPY